jgi:hypothetical protein
MKILIDIGHPAHVHYFKNLIELLTAKGHSVIVIAREKEISFVLLDAYNIPYNSRGKGKNSILGKLLYLLIGAYKVWDIANRNKIDYYLSFASPYNAIASVFFRRPNISFDDTEHNVFNHKIYVPLSESVLTPLSFKRDFGLKQIRFFGSMDSAYLNPKYFLQKNIEFKKSIKTDSSKKKVILRFVSWNASHDINQKGFSNNHIYKLIDALTPYAEIFISSEKKLPEDLEKYNIRINPSDMHYYMQEADLLIGESGSMATEASYLGTHSIVLNSASNEFGVFEWFSNFKTFYIAQNFDDVVIKAIDLLKRIDLEFEAKRESQKIIDQSICLTDFMVWFIEDYPNSVKIMNENPDYQYRFK